MPCVVIDIGENGETAVVCGLPRRNRCCYCGKPSEFLCDFPVVVKKWLGLRKSCDRNLCRKCVAHGVSENIDFCRHHYSQALAAYQRRMAQSA